MENRRSMRYFIHNLNFMHKLPEGKKKMIDSNNSPGGAESSNSQPEWVINVNYHLQEGFTYDVGRSWTIHRVPSNMRDVYRKAYIPRLISIGPFHYGDRRLESMEQHKMRYLLRTLRNKFQVNKKLQEGTGPRPNDGLQLLVSAMSDLEQRARACYSEVFHIQSDDFVRMMVVDGCFVVELLRLYYKFDVEDNGTVSDPIFTTRWMLRSLQCDLIMLENQIPFFVLEELYKLTKVEETEPPLSMLVVTFFDPLLPRENVREKLKPRGEFDHMLDVFLSTFLSSMEDRVRSWKHLQITSNIPLVQERQLIHCATELSETGLVFKRKEASNLLDISFNSRNGTLSIPPLYIDDNTVPLFLNFLAYEQCDEEAKPFFTNYFMFLDSLINTSKDVAILHKNGIINHVLGSDKDVTNLFNKLCREIVYDLDECYLSEQMKDINQYCKRYYAKKWRVWLTHLKRKYFSNPWTAISLLVAMVLLLLTLTETFYTVYDHYKPSRT